MLVDPFYVLLGAIKAKSSEASRQNVTCLTRQVFFQLLSDHGLLGDVEMYAESPLKQSSTGGLQKTGEKNFAQLLAKAQSAQSLGKRSHSVSEAIVDMRLRFPVTPR